MLDVVQNITLLVAFTSDFQYDIISSFTMSVIPVDLSQSQAASREGCRIFPVYLGWSQESLEKSKQEKPARS